jgi:CRISPR-associated endonuclease/helicase Cas3
MGKVGRFYAHTPGKRGVWHDLISHLERTANAAGKNGSKFGAGKLARLAGLWHDIGKFNPEFQEYLKRCEQAARADEPAPSKGMPHAAFGGRFARGAYPPLMQIIYGHHAGLQETEQVKQRSPLRGLQP